MRDFQPPPAAVALLTATRALYEAMYRFDGAVAERLGVHRSDVRGLNALEQGPLSPGELGARLGLTSGAVTALVDRLLAARLVTREPHPSDRRRWQIALRPQAYRRLDALFSRLGEEIAGAMDALPAATRGAMPDGVATLAVSFDHAATAIGEAAAR